MKHKLKSFLLGVSLSLVVADVALAIDQIPMDRTITKIQTFNNFAVVHFTPDWFSTLGCGNLQLSDNAVIIDFSQNKNMKAMYTAALSAYLLGKNVGFGTDVCHAWGSGVPSAFRLDVAQ